MFDEVKFIEAIREGVRIEVQPLKEMIEFSMDVPVNTQKACEMLGVSYPTLRKKVDSGELPCLKGKGNPRFLIRDLYEYKRKQR